MKRLYKIGTLAQDSVQGLKTIFKTCNVGRYNTLETSYGIDYRVPLLKKFYITHILINGDTDGTLVGLLYGDTAVNDSIPPPTNPVYISPSYKSKEAHVNYNYDVFFEIPALKYPAIGSIVGGAAVEIQGLEI